jgi:thiosulfate/3-mercaptopyruvate sulfurtransferase
MLITCAEIAQHLAQHLAAGDDSDQWIVFDCRHDLMDTAKGERAYREGHIPGAYFAHLDTDLSGEKTGRNGRHPLPSPAAFLGFLARHGVTASSKVIAYDDVGGQFASRLWWLARWVGLRDVCLLDGGITAWLAEGHALSSAVPVPRPTPLAGHADPLKLTSAEELLPRLESADLCLIDARAPERFRGDVEPIDPIAGHIPGAHNRFYQQNFNADMTFKSAEALRAEFETLLDGKHPSQVVHQCGSGVTACVNAFAMELAGLRGSTLYAGSWSEWIADPTRPIDRG